MAKAKPKSKNNNLISKVPTWVKTHRIISMAIIAVILILGFIDYNKYLDYRNVNDMKTLLSDFQQLEKTIEAETGEEFTIVASCGSVGKFASSYACSVSLKPTSLVVNSDITASYLNNSGEIANLYCGQYSQIGYLVTDATKNYYGCSPLHVRPSNEAKSEEIFFKYDTTPGQP